MQVVSIISTKGGVGKTTTAANLGGFVADAGLPVHRIEYRQPTGRVAPAALETMRSLAIELFPLWKEPLARVSGRPQHPHQPGSARHGQHA